MTTAQTLTTDLPRPTPIHGDRSQLRAMKRALAHAPLGPKATLALSHAILALEENLAATERARRAGPGTTTPDAV